MKLFRIICIFNLFCNTTVSAKIIELDSDYCDWYFSIGKNKKQYMAIVPGSNINDLICNQLIPDPYRDNNLSKLKWIEDSSFTYVTAFNIEVRNEFTYEIIFEGLDTYAEVYLNNQLVLKGSNMFISYQKDISQQLRDGTNLLKIVFKSTVEAGKKKAERSNIIYPADNEEGDVKISPFVRKAAFQFGWDINPRLVSCGVWRPIKIVSHKKNAESTVKKITNESQVKPFYTARFETDSAGQSFQFYSNEKKPVHTFMYGANYVPYNMYPLPVKTYIRTAHIQKFQGLPNRYDYYRNLFSELKSYGCNMLRVWGGGWYEDDYFYDLADSMHIAIWQDFMFANTMYPGDTDWLNTVKEEISQQVERLSKHPSLVLWSGNNEIEVAWNNWGWQTTYDYSMADSVKLINDYKILFEGIIPNEIKKQKNNVAYISSSPMSNWGSAEDFNHGDNHYWGVWHGEAPLEDFYTHIPRFASEYGMPSLGTNASINKFNSDGHNTVQFRMKSYKGMKLLNQYIAEYLPIPTSDIALSYASRYIQYKALKMAYNAHAFNFPYCSGSLFWQFNESWPGFTWAAIDFSGDRKIPPYKSPVAMIVDKTSHFKINYSSINNAFKNLSAIEFSLKNMQGKLLTSKAFYYPPNQEIDHDIIFDLADMIEKYDNFNAEQTYLTLSFYKRIKEQKQIVFDTLITIYKEKDYKLNKPEFKISLVDASHLKISSNVLALGVYLESNINKIQFNQNFINLEPGKEKVISFENKGLVIDLNEIKFYSVYDLQVGTK